MNFSHLYQLDAVMYAEVSNSIWIVKIIYLGISDVFHVGLADHEVFIRKFFNMGWIYVGLTVLSSRLHSLT